MEYTTENNTNAETNNAVLNFIINPASKSGIGLSIWKEIKPFLAENEIKFKAYKTSLEKDVTYYVRNIINKNPGSNIKIFVLGGDGTINEALQGIPDNEFDRVQIAYIPTGSSNDLAKALDYGKDSIETCKHLILSNTYKELDLGLVEYNHAETPGYTKRKFIVSCGIGYDAAVCEETNNSPWKKVLNKLKLGKMSYLFICLKQLFSTRKVPATIICYKPSAEIIRMDKCYFVVAMNHCYQGGGIKFCPDAVNNDGLLDICYAHDISKFRVLSTLPFAYSGKHIGMKGIGNLQCSKLNIKFDEAQWVHTDGEVKTKASDITITCLPQKLKFIV